MTSVPSRNTTPTTGAATTTTGTTTMMLPPQNEPPLILHLRLPEPPPRPTVTWDAGTIDNEGMNKRKSKKCCIFHKQRPFDESDSEHSSDEDDDGGWELDEHGKPKWVPAENSKRHQHDCMCGGDDSA